MTDEEMMIDLIQTAKQSVAREILEEIDKHGLWHTPNGPVKGLDLETIKELRNKYLGGEG